MPSENIHMTLFFLGNVSLDGIPKLIKILEETLDLNHFRASVIKTGVFPSVWNPKILWLGVGSGRQKIIALQKQVGKVAASFKVGKKKERFIPHITIGRVALSGSKIDFLPFLKYVYSHIELDVNSLALYESQPLPEGAAYKMLTTFPLN